MASYVGPENTSARHTCWRPTVQVWDYRSARRGGQATADHSLPTESQCTSSPSCILWFKVAGAAFCICPSAVTWAPAADAMQARGAVATPASSGHCQLNNGPSHTTSCRAAAVAAPRLIHWVGSHRQLTFVSLQLTLQIRDKSILSFGFIKLYAVGQTVGS